MWFLDNIASAITAATALLIVFVAFERRILSAVRLGQRIFEEVSCLTKKKFNPQKERILIS